MMSLTYIFMVINKEDTLKSIAMNRNVAFRSGLLNFLYALIFYLFNYLFLFGFSFEHMFKEFARHM